MTDITAKAILISEAQNRPRLATLLLRYPRFIHAELMTHRAFSRNSASSRAIPIKKLIQDVEDNPAVPIFWGKNQPGMQAGEELTGDELFNAQHLWKMSRLSTLNAAKELMKTGAHKQIVNRLLEPHAHITVLVTSTNWSNFLWLRDHEAAEPHIRLLATKVDEALKDKSSTQFLYDGEWHLPFSSHDDKEEILDSSIKLSVARCASTSYKTVDGFDMDISRAEKIYNSLLKSDRVHASPFEHVAQADTMISNKSGWENAKLSGNFAKGWIQLRKTIPNESIDSD